MKADQYPTCRGCGEVVGHQAHCLMLDIHILKSQLATAVQRAEAAERETLNVAHMLDKTATMRGVAEIRAERAERRAEALVADNARLREALVETLIPLEALWMVYHDDTRAFAPESKAEIRNGIEKGRVAIAASAPAGTEGEGQ